MDEELIGGLRWVAIGLAVGVAGIHLLHPSAGGAALLVYANVGTLGDPRPPLFVLGGFILVFASLLVYHDVYRRAAYLAFAAVAVSFLLGYGLWHTVLDHGGFWPHIQAHSHSEGNPVVVVARHLAADALEFGSKVAELALLVVALVLYRVDEGT